MSAAWYLNPFPRLVRLDTKTGQRLASEGVLRPLSELPEGWEVSPAGRLRRTKKKPRTKPPPTPRELSAAAAIVRGLRAARDSGPGLTIFRNAQRLPVAPPAGVPFPADLTRLEAARIGIRLGARPAPVPSTVEPYRGPFGAPVVLIFAGEQRLKGLKAAFRQLVAAGGYLLRQELLPDEVGAGRPLVDLNPRAWLPLPKSIAIGRRPVSLSGLLNLEKVLETFRGRGSDVSATYALTTAPPPPGPPPGLGALRRLRQSRAGDCILDRIRDALAAPKRKPAAALAAQREAAFEKWSRRLEASGGFSLDADRRELERDFRVILQPRDAGGLGVFDAGPPTGFKDAKKGAAVPFLAHNGHAFRLPCANGGALLAPRPEAEATFPPAENDPDGRKACQAAIDAQLAEMQAGGAPRLVYECGAGFLVAPEDGAPTIWRPEAARADLIASARLLAGGNGLRYEQLVGRALLHPGGAAGFRFSEWTRSQGLLPCPQALRGAWRAACHEALNWDAGGAREARATRVLDMRAAYLAHDARKTRAAGGAADLVARFGWPSGRMMRGASLVDAGGASELIGPDWWGFELCGAVRLTEWSVPAHVPEVIAADVWAGLSNGWACLPDLFDLIQAGELVDVRADLLTWDADPLPGLKFPTRSPASEGAPPGSDTRAKLERLEGVEAVGRCMSGAARLNRLHTGDRTEGEALVHALQAAGRPAWWEPSDSGGCLAWDPAAPGAHHPGDQHAGVRAFVLAYHAVALRRALRRFGPGQVQRVRTDSVRFTGEAPQGLDKGAAALWGEWRAKVEADTCALGWSPALREWRLDQYEGATVDLGPNPPPAPKDPRQGVAAEMIPATLTRASFCWPALLAAGVAGGGKTSTLLRATAGADRLAVGPSHQRRKALEAAGVPAKTFHAAFGVRIAPPEVAPKAAAAWSAAAFRRDLKDQAPALLEKLAALPSIVIIDEAGQLGAELLAPVIAEARRRGVQVFASYGRGQVCPPSGADPGRALEKWAGASAHEFTHHARAQCSRLAELSAALYRAPNEATRVGLLEAAIPATDWDAFADEWRPGDVVITSTHAERRAVEELLHPVHAARHPEKPARVVYHPETAGAEAWATLPDGEGLTRVRACRGDVFDLDAQRLTEGPLPPGWRWATAGTCHSSQGDTVEEPARVWVVSSYLRARWATGSAYVAATRPRRLDQLRRVG